MSIESDRRNDELKLKEEEHKQKKAQTKALSERRAKVFGEIRNEK
jgi:hypothetical protein